jgi:hypothetical protein
MPCDPEKLKKLDTMLDAWHSSRKADESFEEAKHPRQAGGVFAPKGEEAEGDTQDEPGNLGKKFAS